MAAKSPMESGGDYEKYREERIKANKERMEKLGLLQLSRQAAAAAASSCAAPKPTITTPKNPKSKRTLIPTADDDKPSRRSTRLQNSPAVNYKDTPDKKKREPKSLAIVIKQGNEEEFYTEEHEKLLGSCEVAWTGEECKKNGARIYDQVDGKSCHQCRQKTMGYRTSCCKCRIVQGQFCGDCLYTRYGENVVEAMKNTEWVCPACRGICNCSNCRIKKGWNPTGPIYKKVANLGYKSVAHYLIQTRRKPAESDQAPSSETEAAMSDSTEAAKENEPNPEIIVLEKTDESNATNDEETAGKRHGPFKRKKKEDERSDSISPGPVAARLRRRHYGI